MIVAGCDVGSLTAKAVIMQDNRILAAEIIRVAANPEKAAQDVIHKAVASAKISTQDIDYCVGTGYGRNRVPFVNHVESEITCHARGAFHVAPTVRTVIDIGGQDAKAIRLDDKGNVLRYSYNDKCASGTGRFLEVMAIALGVELDELGLLALDSENPISISSQCTVFAETEVVSLINEGKSAPDLARGLHKALANRVVALARSNGVDSNIAFTGGVAKNQGMFKALEEALGTTIISVPDPQLIGAIGAALVAQDSVKS